MVLVGHVVRGTALRCDETSPPSRTRDGCSALRAAALRLGYIGLAIIRLLCSDIKMQSRFAARKAAYKGRSFRGVTPRQRSVNAIVKRALRAPLRNVIANKETGYVDLATATYAMDTTGSLALIATVAQGASVNQRVGKKIMLKSLQCRGYMANNTSALINDVAFLIVYDKRPTGALPAITDILASVSSSALNNDVNSGRFKVLKRVDALMLGAPATSTGTGDSAISVDFFLPLRDQIVFKAAGTGAIADIEEGALYLVTVGSTAAGVAAAAANMSFRTRFIDI